MSRRLAAVVVAASGLLAGCGTGADAAAPTAVSAAFYSAVRAQDSGRACELLADQTRRQLEESEGTSCSQALGAAGLAAGDVTDVQVFGRQAMVEVEGDTAFLAHLAAGWRVTAAGCTARPGRPYDCELEAG